MNKQVKWLFALLGIAVVGVAALLYFRPSTQKTTWSVSTPTATSLEAQKVATVQLSNLSVVRANIAVATVEKRSVENTISAIGLIVAPETGERTIAARARGRIEKLFVNATGTYVKQGEPLFDFYSPEILNAEQELLIAEREKRDNEIMASPAMHHGHPNTGLIEVGRKRLALYGLTSEHIRALETNGELTNVVRVTSPASGLVVQKQTQEGAYVDEGTTIFQLVDLSTVWAEVDVQETDISSVKLGQTVTIQSNAYPNLHFSGPIIFISPMEDQASRTVRVRASFNNTGYKLRPGMTFTAQINSGSESALAVPTSAVVRSGTGDFVWVHDGDNVFLSHQVTLGPSSGDGFTLIRSGLKGGEAVAVQGAFMLDAEHQISENNPMAGMDMSKGSESGKSSGESTGLVRGIDKQKQTITLDHGNIPGVMAAMTMAYRASSAAMLEKVKVNASVRFTLTRVSDGQYEITDIEAQ